MEMTSYFDMPRDESKEFCDEYCEYSRYCRYGKREIGKKPDNCPEYTKLEKIAWDAEQDRIAEAMERDREYEPEDDDDWEE